MAKNKILVVDDELHIRMLYQEELEAEGYSVATSDGSEHIVSLVEREKPDVIVLDIKLGPERSGLDLLQELRGSSYQSLPVILCTAYDTFQHDFKSIAADYYVIKSIDLTELKSKIQQALKKTGAESKGAEPRSDLG
jgi:DNA-binding response OmpR family regulator